MSRKGLLALGTLALLTLMMVGAWSYSRATMDNDGFLTIASPDNALIGTPDFALMDPVVSVYRGSTGTGRFDIDVNTANDVSLTLDLIDAHPELSAELWVKGDKGAVKISPTGGEDPPIAARLHTVKAKLIAQGSGFRAEIDLEIPVEVKNAPIVARKDWAIARENTPVTIDVVANDTNPDGPIRLESISGLDGDEGSARITDNKIVFTPAKPGLVKFRYKVTGTDGEYDTAKVRVWVKRARGDDDDDDDCDDETSSLTTL